MNMQHLPSASKLDRVMRCPLSETLPHTPDAPTTHTVAGTDRHERIADVIAGDAPRDTVPWDVHGVLALPPDAEVHAECALAWNIARAELKHIGDNLKRGYPREADTICGTADVVAILPDRVVVADWKGPHAWLPPAAENWQLLALAVMACGAFERRLATIATVRVYDDALGNPDRADLDEDALSASTAALLSVLSSIRRARAGQLKLSPNPGEWCAYCPARNACPVYGESARELQTLASDDAWLARLSAEVERDPGRVYEFAERAGKVLAEAWKMLEYRADKGGCFALSDGSTVERVSEERRSIDGKRALPVLRACGAEDAIEPRVSVTALERLLRAQYPGRGLAVAKIRDTMTALESAGALTVSGVRKWKRTNASGGNGR